MVTVLIEGADWLPEGGIETVIQSGLWQCDNDRVEQLLNDFTGMEYPAGYALYPDNDRALFVADHLRTLRATVIELDPVDEDLESDLLLVH